MAKVETVSQDSVASPTVEYGKMVQGENPSPVAANGGQPGSHPQSPFLFRPPFRQARCEEDKVIDGKPYHLHLEAPRATRFTGWATLVTGTAALLSAGLLFYSNTRNFNQSVAQFTELRTADQVRDAHARLSDDYN